MSDQYDSPSDYDLHAYVDGELSARRRAEVEAWLASHPDAAARVRDYQSIQKALHGRFDSILTETATLPPVYRRERLPFVLRAAVLAGLMLASGVVGWSLGNRVGSDVPAVVLADLVQPAAFAHRIYSTDTRYPVEIPAIEQAALNHWVSQRMHTDLRAPDLSAKQFTFIGGRLLPSTNRMAAQFMYEDKQGERLTLYVRRITHQTGLNDFQYRELDGLQIFYWVDNAMGFAVIADLKPAQLIEVANAVQAAFRQAPNGLQ